MAITLFRGFWIFPSKSFFLECVEFLRGSASRLFTSYLCWNTNVEHIFLPLYSLFRDVIL